MARREVARCAGARLVVGTATRVSRAERVVELAGERLAFDACAIDVGSAPAGTGLPGVLEHAIPLRPMSRAREVRARVDALLAADERADVVVVGAGAGGVEVAFALMRRIAERGARGGVTLVDGSGTLLPGEPPAMQERVTDLLRAAGVGTVLGRAVASVQPREVHLASGAVLPAGLVVWTTGAAPPAVLAASDLPVDTKGYLLVDRTLLATGGEGVWGAGDCIAMVGQPGLPRSGAYALRQGGTLLHNIRAALGTGRPRVYRPRHRALAILDTADGAAVARWGGHHAYGPWAWRLKRRIDLRFVSRFREPCDETRVAAS
jgi:selenide,water dikinase